MKAGNLEGHPRLETRTHCHEYDNEYTFISDGSYVIDNINGDMMSPWVYSTFEVDPGDIVHTTSYGFFQITHPNPTGATWTLHENADLTIETVYGSPAPSLSGNAL